ncbi:4-hydroxy-tetrahydrodipicolinate synthase [Pelagibaculum spongiae]|uniref:4-hydroxy-tetrahydrodipicolinate synthase n=1 Tax=Pelagibaculum spongiae TaxID=2080658 RepID=A0A2V1GWF9_9GAMM|nr:4-hydroxy-tetrahydrodipicolinate synthase [Pelagibaculum spongiae]PVZ69664.1 4-hydroxy-tetrahydrodipicolinate synthase [Pelagibaculum spongiae]
MITGSIVALVTPMTDQGGVDEAALDNLVEWHIEQGTDAIVAVGTTGESATLTPREHMDVIYQVVRKSAGRVPVIAGTGANATHEAIELTHSARIAGADACLLVTPYYNKPTPEGLYQHFKAIAEAEPLIPQILYNVPGRTACDMLPETVGRLAQIDNIVGIKEATGDVSRVAALRELCGNDFALYTGDDATTVEFLLAGGNGAISVTNNVVPHDMAEMCAAALAGDRARAEQINTRLELLHSRLFCESNPIPVKWALAEMGKMGHGIRLPLTMLSQEQHASVREALVESGALA